MGNCTSSYQPKPIKPVIKTNPNNKIESNVSVKTDLDVKPIINLDTNINLNDITEQLDKYNAYGYKKITFKQMIIMYQQAIYLYQNVLMLQNSGIEQENYLNRLLQFVDRLVEMNRYNDKHINENNFGKEQKLFLLSLYKVFISQCDNNTLINIVLNYIIHTSSFDYYQDLKGKISYFTEVNQEKLALIFEKILTSEEYKSQPLDKNHKILYVIYTELSANFFENIYLIMIRFSKENLIIMRYIFPKTLKCFLI
jgi:hypothetical protein